MRFLKLPLLLWVFLVSPQLTEAQTFVLDESELTNILSYLASDELEGREAGSPGIEKAAVFIENYFTVLGLKPFFLSYRDTLSNFEAPAYNIVGLLEGTDPELKNQYIIIGAHYDHIGQGRVNNGDIIANGANDNAAGTTTVLALAKHFAKSKSNKRSLIFALFSAEEKGLLGAKHLAEKLKATHKDYYLMLNFEMLGVPMRETPGKAYLTGFDLTNLAQKVNEFAGEPLIVRLEKAVEFNLFRRSDNLPFYEQLKIPAQTFSTFDFTNSPYYHHVDDEVENLSPESMFVLIEKLIPPIEKLINTPTKEVKFHE
ncbi:MAG: M20/M25/M40 family metallo-hydrolase [Flavobacteriaceae bacterium]|nr:M20/M25/M40 family metallo-hydrolase [Flavobacteriaceae bacterium]